MVRRILVLNPLIITISSRRVVVTPCWCISYIILMFWLRYRVSPEVTLPPPHCVAVLCARKPDRCCLLASYYFTSIYIIGNSLSSLFAWYAFNY